MEDYGRVPPYSGRGRPPTHKQAVDGWHYTQIVKQRNDHVKLTGVEVRVIYGDDTTLERTGTRTTAVERSRLTARHMNGRLVRKTLGFSRRVAMLATTCTWKDVIYNFARPVKTLRCEIYVQGKRWLQASPAMAAELADHIWSIRELLMLVPLPTNSI